MRISRKELINLATYLDKHSDDVSVLVEKEQYSSNTLAVTFTNKVGEDIKIKLYDIETKLFPKITKSERFHL